MKTLILGASGATGKQLVEQLLQKEQEVKIVVRPTSNIPEHWESTEAVTVIREQLHDISVEKMVEHLADCQAVASCLGHNLSFKGIYGKPRKLVRDAVALVCQANKQNQPKKALKVVLMNTAGNSNRDLKESISFGQRIVLGLIRLLLPPHTDNEAAADYLSVQVGQNNSKTEWVVVRPDTLINEEKVTSYTTHTSPTRSAIFNPGKTSRINVGHFMSELITDNKLWKQWQGQMPVIYNEE